MSYGNIQTFKIIDSVWIMYLCHGEIYLIKWSSNGENINIKKINRIIPTNKYSEYLWKKWE